MRPLSFVPTTTPGPCGAGATAKAVTVGELHTTSVPPSAPMRKTALRAVDSSLRLRACGCCWPTACVVVPPSSMTTEVTTPPDDVEDDVYATGCDEVVVAAGADAR